MSGMGRERSAQGPDVEARRGLTINACATKAWTTTVSAASCCSPSARRYGHKPADLRIMASQFHDLAVKLTDLLADGIARFEQRV